ncbi:827_t:CDS:2 [Entrophospora sp. SA101]|nr:827_t:CDS:2 [Entrophospora sp. SA101]
MSSGNRKIVTPIFLAIEIEYLAFNVTSSSEKSLIPFSKSIKKTPLLNDESLKLFHLC